MDKAVQFLRETAMFFRDLSQKYKSRPREYQSITNAAKSCEYTATYIEQLEAAVRELSTNVEHTQASMQLYEYWVLTLHQTLVPVRNGLKREHSNDQMEEHVYFGTVEEAELFKAAVDGLENYAKQREALRSKAQAPEGMVQEAPGGQAPPVFAGFDKSTHFKNTYLFYREQGFYPRECQSDEDAIEQAKQNPGTLKVETPDGRLVWDSRS